MPDIRRGGVLLNGLVGTVFELDLDGTAGVDGGVVYEGVPCVVAVGELGLVGSVGVGLFDAVAFVAAWRICA